MNITILSGAGMSAESGISTFRDAGGLWEGHDIMEVASPQGWDKNPELVNGFYNIRRRELNSVEPNAAHRYLASLEKNYSIQVITQNVDDLHERAGSSQVLHLHGELLKVRSTMYPELVYEWKKDLALTDVCEHGYQLRPHIVWFGEQVPAMDLATPLVHDADLVIVIGTSLQVYPAAGLMHFARPGIPIIYVDPNPAQIELQDDRPLHVINKTACDGIEDLDKIISEIDR